MSRLGDRSEVLGLDWECGQKTIRGSPGLEIDIVSGIELGYSYELGSGQTRIGVMARSRWGLSTVMTVSHKGYCSIINLLLVDTTFIASYTTGSALLVVGGGHAGGASGNCTCCP